MTIINLYLFLLLSKIEQLVKSQKQFFVIPANAGIQSL
jgi:hypothetical protein